MNHSVINYIFMNRIVDPYKKHWKEYKKIIDEEPCEDLNRCFIEELERIWNLKLSLRNMISDEAKEKYIQSHINELRDQILNK